MLLAAQEHQLERGDNCEQHDWAEEHATCNHGDQRTLHLTPDARQKRGCTGGQRGHQHRAHAFFSGMPMETALILGLSCLR